MAFALLLYTAQRRADVIRLGPQHIEGGFICLRQSKTGSEVSIPILPELRKVLDATPSCNLAFLDTNQGKPFSAAGFGNWFHDRVAEAGLSGISAHGLRKAASRRLAEAGCTANEIMAITGHVRIEEVARYTRSADKRHLAVQAFGRLRTKRD